MKLEEQKMIDHVLHVASLSLVSVTIIAALVLAGVTPAVHADDTSVSTATVTVTQSCSMTATTDTPHTANLHNGIYSGADYENGIGKTTLKTFCNDGLGYAIYAIGYTGNEYGNTKLHSNTLGNDYDINTGIYTSGFTVDSTWSMKLSSVAGDFAPTISDGTNNTENFTTWHVIPNEYKKVAYRTTGTDILVNNVGTGSSVEVTYDAYISATQPAGTYVGQVKYTLVHPSTAGKPVTPLKDSDCLAGYVCYAPNASDIEGSMSSLGAIASSSTAGKVSVGTSATTINLIAPNYKRAGYGFAGWSTDFTATNASVIYGPNETITVPDVSSHGLILYPVWIASAGNFQGADGQGWTGCSNTNLTQATYDSTNNKMVATLSSVTALTDTRDGNVYAVAKLADGKCWMIENLRLDNTATITTSNTHNPLHDANNNVILKIDSNTTANHLDVSNNTWCTTSSSGCFNQTMLNTNNTNRGLTASYGGTGSTYQWYGYGNYYNWYSATAGNGTYSKSSGNVAGDLCPTGWHLPYGKNSGTGNTAGGFYYLNTLMSNNTSTQGSKDWRKFPNNFVYSGKFSGSSAVNRKSYGYYWSSSASDYYYADHLILNSSTVRPGTTYDYKYYGWSVRCIAQ